MSVAKGSEVSAQPEAMVIGSANADCTKPGAEAKEPQKSRRSYVRIEDDQRAQLLHMVSTST